MAGPTRASRRNTPYVQASGCLQIICPACEASIGWRCIAYAFDADGNRYEQRRQSIPHPERKEAWREIKAARRPPPRHKKTPPEPGGANT